MPILSSLPFFSKAVDSARTAIRARLKLSGFAAMALLSITACGPMTKIAALSESELRAELTECHNIANPSNSKAIGCQNFKRECEKRVKDDGRYRDC